MLLQTSSMFITGCNKPETTVKNTKTTEIAIYDNSYIQEILTEYNSQKVTVSIIEDSAAQQNTCLSVVISTKKNIQANSVDWNTIAEKFVKAVGILQQYDSLYITFQNYTNAGYYESNSQTGYTYNKPYVDSLKQVVLANDINDYTIMRKYIDGNQWNELEKYTDSLLKNPTKNIIAFVNKARVQINRNEYVPAMNNLLEALRRNPDNGDANFLMGMAYEGRENYTEAVQYYKKVTESVPNWPPAHYQLADMYQKLGMNNEAKTERNVAEKLSGK